MKLFHSISKPLFGILLYSISGLLPTIFDLPLPYSLVIMLPALVLILLGLSQLPRTKHLMYDSNGTMNFLYGFFALQLIVMVLRGFSLEKMLPGANIFGLTYLYLGIPYLFLWVFMPWIVLRMYPHYSLKGFIKYACWICVICIVVTLVDLPNIMQYSLLSALRLAEEGFLPALTYGRMGLTFAALLLLIPYLEKKQRWIIIASFAVNILVCVLYARRGDLAMSLILVVFTLFLFYKRGTSFQKFAIVAISVGLVVLYFSISSSSVFSLLQSRGDEDTRSGVIDALFAGMNGWELVFGKGMNGSYYFGYGIESAEAANGLRFVVETGFYNIVLKGGYLMAITYVLLLLVPAFNGVFRSKNSFCLAGGLFLFWNLIYLYPGGILSFDLNFFFVWMWVILCSMKSVRRMTDDDIKMRFF